MRSGKSKGTGKRRLGTGGPFTLVGALLTASLVAGCVVEARTGSGPVEPVGGTPVAYNNPHNNPPPLANPASPGTPGTPASPATPNTPASPTVNPGNATGPRWGNATGQTGQQSPFGAAALNSGALRGTVYFISQDTQAFPDVSKLQPQGTIYTNSLEVHMHDFNEGFPGLFNRFEWFAIRYDGTFTASKTGDYTFDLVSDDGANLYLDGKQVINNDGRHLPLDKSGKVTLTAGQHAIRVDYFKSMRWVVALELYCTPPGGNKAYWQSTM